MGPGDLLAAFQLCGLQKGDVLFLHSDAFFLAQFPGKDIADKSDFFFSFLEDFLGFEGTLVLPVFTYSFTKNETFDVENSPSSVGILTEIFRKRKGVVRSKDPIFSVSAIGKHAEEFKNASAIDSFGPESSFALLYGLNAKIACLGCSFSRITFTHFAEQKLGVKYRYPKIFKGLIIDNGITSVAEVSYFVRDTSFGTAADLTLLKSRLTERNKLKNSSIGRASLISVAVEDFIDEAALLLSVNPFGLIEAGQEDQ